MRTVSGWPGKRKSSTTRLIRSMPLTLLRVASGCIEGIKKPQDTHAIDAVARCLWPDIVAFFESEEGQKEFEAWKRQQDKENLEQENQLKAA